MAPGVFAIIFIASLVAERAGVSIGFCLLRRFLGVPCPGCGVTTSINALLHGGIADALAANIAGPAVAVVFLAQLTCFVAAALRVVSQQTLLRLSGAIDRVLLWSLLAGWFSHVLIH